MSKVIIFQNDKGGVTLCYPAVDCGLTVEEIARKDVPINTRYAIIDESDVPADHTFFDAWEVELADLNDGIGIGQQQWFIEQYQAEIAAINSEPTPSRGEDQTEEEYFAVVGQLEQSKITRIEQLNKQIATQQAELEALA